MNNVKFLTGTLAQYQGITPASNTFYYITDSKALYLGTLLLSNSGEVAAAVERIAKNESDIVSINAILTKIQGDATVDGSIRKIVAEASDALQAQIGTLGNLSTNAKGDLVSAINEVRAAISAGGTAAAISLDTSVTTEGAAKSYTLYQGETKIGVIDIPKDMVVSSGTVEVNPEGQPEGTYIVLTLANANGDKLYINVGTLVDIYKAQANASQVQITIDSETREISAVIVDGSVDTDALADNAVTTAKIVDANITKAKLATDVQTSLDKADAAKGYADELNTAMNTRVEALETAVGDTGSISTAIKAAEDNAKGYADSLAKNYDAAGSAAQALTDAKLYADGLAGNYATKEQGAKADTALQQADITTGSANGTISVKGQNVAVYGLGEAAFKAADYYEVAGSANSASAAALAEAKTYTDEALAWGTIDGGNVSE